MSGDSDILKIVFGIPACAIVGYLGYQMGGDVVAGIAVVIAATVAYSL